MWRIRRWELTPLSLPRHAMFQEWDVLRWGMLQTWLHWLKICSRITHSILESWLSDCPCCLNNSTFSDWFGLCPLELSEMLPSQFVEQLVAAAVSKKQQGCDCTKFVSLHFKQASTAVLAGFAPSDTPPCPHTILQACSEFFCLHGIGEALWFHTKMHTHRLCTSFSACQVNLSAFNSSHLSKSESPLFP